MAKKKWIQDAINPAHKGYCTPMNKKTCTPRRKALAKRFKSGDLHKKQLGGYSIDHDTPVFQTAGKAPSKVFIPSGTYDTDAGQSMNRMMQQTFQSENPVPTTEQFMQSDRGKQVIDKYKGLGYDLRSGENGKLKFTKNVGDSQLDPNVDIFNRVASGATAIGNMFQGSKLRDQERNQINESMTPKFFQNMQAQGLNNVPAYMEYGGDITLDRSTYYGNGLHGEGTSYPVKQVTTGPNYKIYSRGIDSDTASQRTENDVPMANPKRLSGTGTAIRTGRGPRAMFGGHDNDFNRQPVMEYGGWDQVGFMMQHGGSCDDCMDQYMYGGMGEGLPYDERDMTNVDFGYQGIRQQIPYGRNSIYKTGGNVSVSKAKQILKDNSAQGHTLTEKQRRYFGWIAGGSKPRKEYGGWDQEGFMFQAGGSVDEGFPMPTPDGKGVILPNGNIQYGKGMISPAPPMPQPYSSVSPGFVMPSEDTPGGYVLPSGETVIGKGRIGMAPPMPSYGSVDEGFVMPQTTKNRNRYGQQFVFQTGGFTPQEQGIADQYRKQGFDVTKENGQLKFKKIGAPAQQSQQQFLTAAPTSATDPTQKKLREEQGMAAPAQQKPKANAKSSTPLPGTQAPDQRNQSTAPGAPKTFDKKALKAKYKDNPYLTGSGNRYYWATQTEREFPMTGGNVRNAVVEAAQMNGLDPALLYSSAMEEGMSGAIDDKNWENASQAYVNWTEEDPNRQKEFPVDGFYNYGLDQFPGYAKTLEKKGYLPKGFSNQFTTFGAENEKGEKIKTAAFKSDADALKAKSAMMRLAKDQLETYAKKQGIDLTPEQQQFFMLANYNGGEGNMQKMLKSYKDKGYLKNNDFLTNTKFKPASYDQIYQNVMRRIQPANMMRNEGVFGTGGSNKMQYGGYEEYDPALAEGYIPAYATGGDGKWIQKAIKHPGRCAHPGDENCPEGSPQYNLAMRFKHGDLHKKQAGGYTHDSRRLPYYQTGGYGVGDEVELTPEQIKKLRQQGYQIEEI